MIDFNHLLLTEPYRFLREHERLGSRLILLGLGGSHAYGTNNESSDIDFRGITLNKPSDLIGLTEFEQYTDENTDTVIFTFNKIVRLLLECNPNTIEILGLEEEQYLIKTELGQELLNQKSLFLSKRAIKSFGGYAGAQLRRLQNAVARDSLPQTEKEKHILNSVKNALEDFNKGYSSFGNSQITLFIDKSERPEFDTEIYIDAQLKHMPLRESWNVFSRLNNVIKDYEKIGKRNHKKDDNHLNKHAMHLIRLYMMAIDILEKGEIITNRKEDLPLLIKIRNGGFQRSDKSFDSEFYEILSEYESRLEKAARQSDLPEQPDFERVENFVEVINRRAIENDFL